ncbi:HNH endonuclease [Acidithiobacillus sp.]|uniref:HNH endonuclease n=1 Tax=Acidithiobacillus sp. TaxID=1872118 RepID=UPI0025C450DD|nr:HNH endonuclease [Acidithiobacillus sp.]
MSKGAELSQKLGIPCKQALYSSWGNFYGAITDFPCALFDKNGFVIINSKDDLEALRIKVAKRTNVPHLISSLPTYQLLSAWRVSLPEELPLGTGHAEYFEGAAVTVIVNRYERDRTARNKCISHYGSICQACGIELSGVYGPVADGFIHVHHIKPISSVKTKYELDPIHDLRPLCPNCHAITHLRQEPYSIAELRAMISEARKHGSQETPTD